MTTLPMPRCFRCNKTADELSEYDSYAKDEGISNAEYVEREEGTFNVVNGHFACTSCYIAIGMPSSPRGWVAP